MAFVIDDGKPMQKRGFSKWRIAAACVLLVGACFGGWRYYEFRHEYTVAGDEYASLQAYKPVPKNDTDAIFGGADSGQEPVFVESGSGLDIVTGPDTGEAKVEDQSVVPNDETAPGVGGTDGGITDVNASYVCWIEIPGTKVDYPVAHGSDDVYYLSHTFSGTYNKCGSIFLAAGNTGFDDRHVVVYGHNMLDGSMFGELKKYGDHDFWADHPEILVSFSDGTVRRYEIFSCYLTDPNDAVYGTSFTDVEYKDLLADMSERALYDTGVKIGDGVQTLTLSTCANSETKRFTVNAVPVP